MFLVVDGGVAAVCSHWGLRVASVNSVDLGFFLVVFIYLLAWLALGC